MRPIVILTLALALTLGLAGAQQAPDVIEVDYLTVAEWQIVEIEWAGDQPYAGASSTFDGRCSVPSHFFARGAGDMINFPMGRHVFGELHVCGRLSWDVDAAGARVFTDMTITDGEYRIDGPGGAFYTASFVSVGTDVDPMSGALVMMLQHLDLEAHDIALPGLVFVSGDLAGPTIVYEVEAFLAGALPSMTLVQGVVRFAPDTATAD